MTPHLLRLTAFGPFAASVSVDLDALAASGLFLLHGPTGAGKTTLLDGIGFALFGRVPGVRNSAKRLRSDHATEAVRTEVQLEATLGGRRMRITRSPQQERAKTRGTGTTTEQAKVLLEEHVDGGWVTMSTRVGEADAEIADLVGMSAEQFFQVVLLPQGEFAQFLRASSVDRAAVLQKLFATERFADVEAWLVARRRSCSEQVAAGRVSLGRLVARIAEVAHVALVDGAPAAPSSAEPAGTRPTVMAASAVPLTEASEVPLADVSADPLADVSTDPLAWAGGLLSAAALAETSAADSVATATGGRDARRAEAEAAVALAGLQQRRRSALERQTELDAAQPQLRELQAELDAASRAAEIAAVLGAVGDRRTSRDEALELLDVARAGLGAAGLDPELAVDALRVAAASARERSGRLEALHSVDVTRVGALTEASLARDEQADALAQGATLEVARTALPARRAAAQAVLAQAREAAGRVPELRAARDALALLRPDVVALGLVTSRIAVLTEEQLSARETAVALGQKALDLKIANVNSMIAVLAFRLEDGVPCDVCGSLEHPDPSQLRDEGVSSDDEERAHREAELAQEHVASLQARLAAEQATALALRDRVGTLTLAQVDAQLASLDVDLAALEATAAQITPTEAVLTALESEATGLATALVAAESRAEACGRRATEADGRAAAAAAELAGVLGEEADLATAVVRAATVASAADQASAASEALVRAQQELDQALAAAASASVAAGFADAEQGLAARRPADWRADAVTKLRDAADLAAAVAADLADPALAVDLTEPAPVDASAGVLAEADAVLATALEELGERRQRRTSLERLLPELQAELVALAPLEEQAREVRSLADLCAGAGANGLKMTLTSFVLAARLEEVAAAASVRLLRMTQGRYSLIHTDGAARGGVRSGLGLLARDGWSGQDRDTSTLSGGETFLASLALALGLADVVSAEAGGSRIGALFVDEGFGTLDEDTLDEVMDVLDGLREGGRIVGVVSHVAELRQRIPAQVHVTKTRSGSDLVLLGC